MFEAFRDSAYLAPPSFKTNGATACTPDTLLSWSKSAIQDSRAYLRLQPAYQYIQDGMDIVNAQWNPSKVTSLSDVTMELTIRNIKELVAAQTNIRIIPSFKTEIQEFKKQEDILNKYFMAWQQMTFADRQIRKAWQYACACGTGYIHVRYMPNYHFKGRGDIVFDPLGPLDVMPLGMGRDHNLQQAYCCTIRLATPIHKLFRAYPAFRDAIRASRDNTKGRGAVIAQSVKYASAVLKRFGPGASNETESMPWETTDVYMHFIDDDEVNNTGHPIPMGEVGTNWSYVVPYVGQNIPDGKGGFKIARHEDCLLYPNKRLIICTEDLCLNPDPMQQVPTHWHGKFPVVQFKADDWPWAYLGFPLTRSGQSIEKANNEMMRGMVDAANARLNPARTYDRNTMSMALAQSINPRIPGTTVGLDQTFAGPDQMKPLLPVNFYDFGAHFLEFISQNEARISHQMGVPDAQSLARARQLPAGDSIDKIMEALGPLVRDQSRNMEESIRGVGELWKSEFFQWIPPKRILSIVGPDGITEEITDYDPGNLIPANQDIVDLIKKGIVEGDVDIWGPEITIVKRAKWHKDHFSFQVTPYSLHELNSITRKLFHLQLMRAGFPIDWWTLAELFDIRNFGPYPMIPDPHAEDPENPAMVPARNIIERWTAQMEIMKRVAAAESGGPGQGKGGGRPPSGQAPPTLEQKKRAGGTESTIRESKR